MTDMSPLKGQTMDTLARPGGNLPDPQAATPYFHIRRKLDEAAERRGLSPEPWAA